MDPNNLIIHLHYRLDENNAYFRCSLIVSFVTEYNSLKFHISVSVSNWNIYKLCIINTLCDIPGFVVKRNGLVSCNI